MSAPEPVEVRAPEGARVLELDWSDGVTTRYAHRALRGFCPCAHCQGHQGPIEWVAATDELDDAALELTDLAEVGQYALSLTWADGHATGIYSFQYLRELGRLVEERCPVAAMMRASGCALRIEWTLALAGAKQPDPDQPPPRCKVKYGL